MTNNRLFNPSLYDRDYFEDGLCTGKSCYVNYRWLPELTIKMAHNFIKHLKLSESDRVLDYGCSKGYLVKALRILDIEAYGCDISDYAIKYSDPDVRDYCYIVMEDLLIPFKGMEFDWLVTKDVLEHMSVANIDILLEKSLSHVKKMFHIIPLGDGGKFRVPEYHQDNSHIQIQDEDWWTKKFEEHGWKVIDFSYKVKGIKDNWTSRYEKGNGFFIIKGRL